MSGMSWFDSFISKITPPWFSNRPTKPDNQAVYQDHSELHSVPREPNVSDIINAIPSEFDNETRPARQALEKFSSSRGLIKALETYRPRPDVFGNSSSSDINRKQLLKNLESGLEKLPWWKRWFWQPGGEELKQLVSWAAQKEPKLKDLNLR